MKEKIVVHINEDDGVVARGVETHIDYLQAAHSKEPYVPVGGDVMTDPGWPEYTDFYHTMQVRLADTTFPEKSRYTYAERFLEFGISPTRVYEKAETDLVIMLTGNGYVFELTPLAERYFQLILEGIIKRWPETEPQLRAQVPELFIDKWKELGIRKPTRQSTLDNWKREYSLLSQLDGQYSYDDEVSPKWEDYIDHIKAETGEEPTERHLRDVKKAGNAGLLR